MLALPCICIVRRCRPRGSGSRGRNKSWDSGPSWIPSTSSDLYSINGLTPFMTSTMSSLKLAVPRASLTLHSKQLRHRLISPIPLLRHASTAPPKPRVLEKPDRFNPPSHGARLPRRQQPKAYPGAPLTSEQQKKRYPNMMPAEGSWMFSFLTNRLLHVWITLSILVSLVLFIWIGDFLHNTPFAHLLPPNSMFLAHPATYLRRYAEVYQMHVDHVSQETGERRRQKVEDVRKRSEFRKAHGLDDGGFGGWTAKSDAEVMGPGMKEGGEVAGLAEVRGGGAGEQEYVDFEGKPVVGRKKWFGSW